MTTEEFVRWATEQETAEAWPQGVPGGTRLAWHVSKDWEVRRPGWYPGHDRCRTSTTQPCPNPVVAVLERRRNLRDGVHFSMVPYAYCADHMYGNKIEDDQVIGPRLVEIEATAEES